MQKIKEISLKTVFFVVAVFVMGTAVGSVSYLTTSKYKENYFGYMKAFYSFFIEAISIMGLMCLVVFGLMFVMSKLYKIIFK